MEQTIQTIAAEILQYYLPPVLLLPEHAIGLGVVLLPSSFDFVLCEIAYSEIEMESGNICEMKCFSLFASDSLQNPLA